MAIWTLKSAAKRLYYVTKLALGEHPRSLSRIRRHGLVPVFNFHRVSPDANPFWSPLSPGTFDELTSYLLKSFAPVTFAELSAGVPVGRKPPAVFSFDDGFVDFLEHAEPILRRHRVRANMNVIPKYSDSGTLPWNFALYDFLERGPAALIREIDLPGISGTDRLDSPARKQRFGLRISAFFKHRPHAEREALWRPVQRLLDRWGERPRERLMSTAEIRELAATHEIGAHSFGHDSMGFETTEFFAADLRSCQEYFQSRLQLPLTIYSFPNGSYRQDQVDYLLQQGLRHVLLVEQELSRPANSVHPRLNVAGDSLAELKVKALGAGGSSPY